MWLKHIPQLHTLYKSYRSKHLLGVIWGSRGSKRLTMWKIKSMMTLSYDPTLRGQKVKICHIFKIFKTLFLLQITWYSHVTHAYWSGRYPLQNVLVFKFILRHLGSEGSEYYFHQKCYDSSIFNSLNIKVIHVHKLERVYLFCGLKGQSGFIWSHRDQNIIFA